MFKTLVVSAIIAVSGSQLYAEPIEQDDLSILPADVAARIVHLQSYGDRYEGAIEAIFAEWARPHFTQSEQHKVDLSILPRDVATRVAKLQKHGDRFDRAIRAIFIEVARPTWGHDDCSQSANFDRPNS